MTPIRILIDSFADKGLLNAQMGNAREIIYRLDPDQFHITTFVVDAPDARISARRNTRLIQLPRRRQTIRILSEFMLGAHDVLFYVKATPASRWYLNLRKKWRDHRPTIGTVEAQCNLKDLEEVTPAALRLWEETVLRCDRLYSNSVYVQGSLQKEYGIASEVIPTGADTRFFTPDWHRQPSSRPQVLFVGSLRERKHPQFVVNAATQFPQADFTIVGEGPLRSSIEAQIAREKLTNVLLTGALGAEKLREEYRRADIFFFPSTFEGSPKVIVEAAACGLPVICRSCYAPETVVNEITGFQAHSEAELLSSLALLLNNPALRTQMGHAGRLHSVQFDWDVIARQWADVFCGMKNSALRYAS